MKVILYRNLSEHIRVNKSLNKMMELEGYLRNSTSILSPVISIEIELSAFNQIAYDDGDICYLDDESNLCDIGYIKNYYETLNNCNYAYIEDFNRYYYIDDLIIENNKLISIILNCDVLMSFKDEFINLEALVSRNEFIYDDMVNDNRIMYEADMDITDTIIDDGQLVNTELGLPKSNIEPPNNIVLVVANDNGENVMNMKTDRIYDSDIFSPELTLWTKGLTGLHLYLLNYSMTSSILIKLFEDFSQYEDGIIAIRSYPFQLEKLSDNKVNIDIKTDSTSVKAYQLKNRLSNFNVIADFTYEPDSITFEDYDNYKYYLYIPYLDYIPISADELIGNRIIVYYLLDYVRGNETVNVVNLTKNSVIYSGDIKLSTDIPISRTNAYEKNITDKLSIVSLIMGATSSASAIFGGAVSGNAPMVEGGILSGINTGVNYAKNKYLNYVKSTTQIGSGGNGGYLCNKCRLKIIKAKPQDVGDMWIKSNGKPLNKTVNLNTLSGYTEVSEIYIENTHATETEIKDIKALLKSGVIL